MHDKALQVNDFITCVMCINSGTIDINYLLSRKSFHTNVSYQSTLEVCYCKRWLYTHMHFCSMNVCTAVLYFNENVHLCTNVYMIIRAYFFFFFLKKGVGEKRKKAERSNIDEMSYSSFLTTRFFCIALSKFIVNCYLSLNATLFAD